jgi:peptidyl-prolyl cis-trans isomerase B (cyclophilin B)
MSAPVIASQGWPLPPARTDGLAVAALVLGVCGFGLLPVVFGHVALRRIRRTGDQGAGLAIAGLVLGYLALAAAAVGVVLLVLAVGIPLWAAAASGALS